MGKEILERNKRKNGPIISAITEHRSEEPYNQIFKVYDEKFWNKPENINVAKTATKKITEFYKGERSSKDTFDLEKMAAFFAVLDSTYTLHALFFNSKLYYNPLSGLFEPVPRDGHRQLPNYHKFNKNYYEKTILDSIFEPESSEELGNNLQIPSGRQWWIEKFFVNKNVLIPRFLKSKGEVKRLKKINLKSLISDNKEKYPFTPENYVSDLLAGSVHKNEETHQNFIYEISKKRLKTEKDRIGYHEARIKDNVKRWGWYYITCKIK